MKIKVRSILGISKILGGRSIDVEVDEPATLAQLLETLTSTYGKQFYEAVCSEDGYPVERVALLINGVSAVAKDGIKTILHEDDDILILPILRGG